MLWAGVEGETPADTDRMVHLAQRCEQWARDAGLPAENRRFRPHITLGRVGASARSLRPLIDEITTAECRSAFAAIGSVALMSSRLGQEGAEYTVVASAPLGPANLGA